MTVTVADPELKARHRSMWASGDYPSDGRDVPAAARPPGSFSAAGIGPGHARARRGRRHGQRVAARGAGRCTRDRERPDARAAGRRAVAAPKPAGWSSE